jgi:hypothetical protein
MTGFAALDSSYGPGLQDDGETHGGFSGNWSKTSMSWKRIFKIFPVIFPVLRESHGSRPGPDGTLLQGP